MRKIHCHISHQILFRLSTEADHLSFEGDGGGGGVFRSKMNFFSEINVP